MYVVTWKHSLILVWFLEEVVWLNYLKLSEDDVISSVTLWIIADFDKPSGRKLLFNALKFMVSI